ncbi:hypothetical protein MGYG_06016 [Nannizzia gypsea CBS 118893]|uniref:Uncharacterized protein n=1 Tax=Arthroderma gypseum (strain ATCC MYA-4604 / CBS 118893) TaxID=535722 RepID=E4V079_ARTGP|nr:hypothetical protein MGYG_06016 [Nannizzia gypsea CBS 118893]EFR03016.1 hypothetical protein MGYG_06016 [Nannizzia gypsea CBS 118893]
MRTQENIVIRDGHLSEVERLSEEMENSWKCGTFWVVYGLCNSWTLDKAWPFIDQALFGGKETPEQRLDLFDQRLQPAGHEREETGRFVQRKPSDRKQRARSHGIWG